MNRPLKIFVIAGEASGDQMAANVIGDLQEQFDQIEIMGIGGEKLAGKGLRSLFPMTDLSVMGIFEVLPKLPLLTKRIKQTVDSIVEQKPDIVLSFDSPDFCFRVVKKAKKKLGKDRTTQFFHVVAPTVWAWRPGRAKKIAKFLDHLFCLFPFEPPYFTIEGLDASYLIHPLMVEYQNSPDGNAWRKENEIDDQTPLIGLFPGSRVGEVERHLPIYLDAAHGVLKQKENARFVLLTLPHLAENIRSMVGGELPIQITTETDRKVEILKACDAALTTSGTMGFELALAGTPHVSAYKMSALSAIIAKRLVKTPFVHLLNIHLQEMVVPEVIQEQCTPDRLTREVIALLDDEAIRQKQEIGFETLKKQLLGQPDNPSVVDVIQRSL